MFFKQVENTVGKGEIAYNEKFLLFPKCFQKTCNEDMKKPGLIWERVNIPASTLTETSILYTRIARLTHGWTDRQADSSIPPKTLVLRGYKYGGYQHFLLFLYCLLKASSLRICNLRIENKSYFST